MTWSSGREPTGWGVSSARNRSTIIDSSAAASRTLMIGSSNFSRNFFQSGSRGGGVGGVVPERPAPLGAPVVGGAGAAPGGGGRKTYLDGRMGRPSTRTPLGAGPLR